jgi:hypothetical protein
MLCFSISSLLYVVYDIVQLNCKATASRNLDADGTHFQTIKLSVKDFRNTKEEELWHNGSLYDIHSYVVVNDTVILTVLQDEGETRIVKSITESFETSDRYAADGRAHISRHHVHLSDDGKVLQSPYKHTSVISGSAVHFVCSRFLVYTGQSFTAIIKPPPQQTVV